nr:dipeptidase [Ardenticatena sp.]
MTTPRDYASAHRSRFVEELKAFLRIPSISTLSEHAADVRRAAEWLAEQMRVAGIQHVELVETGGHPIVYGEWLGAGPNAPTVVVYGHYDVQPVDPLDEWKTPPFEPTIIGENIYARGATDDKGQLFIHVKAAEAYLKTIGRLPVNIKYIFEGEEEVGSVHLDTFIAENRERLAASSAIISDTHILGPETPSIVYGLRGLAYIEVTVQGPRNDLHSGLYGGAVENPALVLARMLAHLHDEHGRVTIPGFYGAVRPLTPLERESLAQIPYGEEELKAETGVPAVWGEPEYSIVERIGARPTLDVNGMWAGFTGEGAKTIIPARASAKISMRLVPDQDPDDIAQRAIAYLQELAPPTVTFSAKTLHGGKPALIPLDSVPMQAAAAAFEAVWGKRPIFTREGGSIPVVATFMDILGAPPVMLGFGLGDDNLHAPNEKFYLPNFYRGIDTVIEYMRLLAEMS